MRREPQELRSILERYEERLAPPDPLAAVQRRWREAVGEQIAEEAWPEAERAGKVMVRCESAVWAAELTMLADTLLAQLNEHLPRERQVLSLKFTAAPSRRLSRERPA
jgi:predicted nucleic acid-binding Zn ribbon protein